ncbi:breast cancer anti-estrogen resistance protein 1-like isoform X2 [Dendronephthya gigantea]|uniref:breast cancer anti-estrogen resistance protein 1-like isoform X2 n=1 Tax=Dendronephthya gigantea TaxID=151771 RepID=UPI00106B76A9|nr:breast cancer anti-estrogen resistance protein 1-like isoform X2 [Dendronephthya gigantea]
MQYYAVVLAKALYSNDSEADDELSFRKGDVITVLETDFEGMEGWWLCSLGDKQGVAPGNRLQLISFDDDNTTEPQDVYDTPGQAYKERYGDVDYDVPKPFADDDDYAIPKSPYDAYPAPESQRHGYVLPSPRVISAERNSNSSDGLITNEIYAAPSSHYSSERSSDEFRFSGEMSHGSGSEEMYDVPSRNSLECDDGQRNTLLPVIPPKARDVASDGHHSNSGSRHGSQEIYSFPAGTGQSGSELNGKYTDDMTYDQLPGNEIYDQLPHNDVKQFDHQVSTVSSDGEDYATIPSPSIIDPPQEIYDVPPAAPEELYDTLPSGLEEVYDVPPIGPEAFYDELPLGEKADGNNNPPVVSGSIESRPQVYEERPGRVEEIYDNFADKGVKGNTGSLNRKRIESDDYVDYQEIYGIGENEPAKTNKDSQQKEQSVLEKIHMDKVRELRVSHNVAMHNLDKLQQAVDVAVTKLMSFVTDDWRRSEVYALNINGIREISGKVKVALRLLTEFGLGALKNSKKLPDKEIAGRIEEALKPLLESYYSIKSAIQRLDESNWRSAYQEKPEDDLNTIAKLAQCIPCGAYNLGAVIANVAYILFTGETRDDNTPSHPKIIVETSEATQNQLSPATAQIEKPEARRLFQEPVSPTPLVTAQRSNPTSPVVRNSSPEPISPSPAVDAQQTVTQNPEARKSFQDAVSPTPVAVQAESTKQPEASKMEPETAKTLPQETKTPPVVQPKPKRVRKRSDSAPNPPTLSDIDRTQLLSDHVSELTNNLLNQIDTIKSPSEGLSRKGSKKLSPRTVRRLCSITLKNDDRINEKMFEDVTAIPPKPSRQCSSPATPVTPAGDQHSSLTGTMSYPGSLHSDIFNQTSFESMKSFVEKMNSEFMVLKEAIKSFGESVRERHMPKIFVAHSKFIVLSAHKLVYIGDGASRTVIGEDRAKISSVTNSLSEVINIFVEDIKIAARQYPEEAAMNTMIKSATNVTEKALGLYKALKRQAS